MKSTFTKLRFENERLKGYCYVLLALVASLAVRYFGGW